ncbi:MAG: alpha/beta hydrolase [Bacteroidia bacterium]|nr:alpha/beta hydrolase [Bacteroidia bacterium]
MKSDKLFHLYENRTELPTLGSVFYESTGNNTGTLPLVLIHGFPFDRRLWYNLIPELDQTPVIIPDLPGVGNSTLLQPACTMNDYADVIAAILEKEQIKKCVVAGHSMGGYAALAFANKYPDKLAGLSLVHSTAYADDADRKQKRDQTIAFLNEYGASPFVNAFIPGPFAPGYSNEDELKKLKNWAADCTTQGLITMVNAMKNREDLTQLLASTNVPVQWIIGKLDPVFLYTGSIQQATLSKISMIDLLPDCGHMGMIEKPEETAEALRRFLDYCVRRLKL